MFENFRKNLAKAVSALLVSAGSDPSGAKTLLQQMSTQDPDLHAKVTAEIAGRVDPLNAAAQWVGMVKAGNAAESYRVWSSLNEHNPEAAALALVQAKSLPQFGAYREYTIAQATDAVIGDLTDSNHGAAVDRLVTLNDRDPEAAQAVFTQASAQFPNLLPGLIRKRDTEDFLAAGVDDAVAQIQKCTPDNEDFGVELVRAKSEQDPAFALALVRKFYADGMVTASAGDVVEIVTAGALHMDGAQTEAADAVNRRFVELAQTNPAGAVRILSAVAASSVEVVDTMASGVWAHLSDDQKAAYETAFAQLNREECQTLVTHCAEQPDEAVEAIHTAAGGDVEAMKRIALEVAEIEGSDVARAALEQLITSSEPAAKPLPRKPKKGQATTASGSTDSALMLLLNSPTTAKGYENNGDDDDDDADDDDDDGEIEIVEAKAKKKKEWTPPWLDKDGKKKDDDDDDGDDADDKKAKGKGKADGDGKPEKKKKKKTETASADLPVYAPVVSASAEVDPKALRLFLVDDTLQNAQYAIYVNDQPLGRLRLATAMADPKRSHKTFVAPTFGQHQIDAIRQTGWAAYAQAMKVEPYADGTTRRELLQAAAKEQEPVLAVAAAERLAARSQRLEECRGVVLAGYQADYYTANPMVTALSRVLRGVGHTDPDSTARQLFLEAGADSLRAVEDEAQRLAAQPDEVIQEACHQINQRGTTAPKVTTTAVTAGIQIQVPRTEHNVPFRASQTAGTIQASAGDGEPAPYWEV